MDWQSRLISVYVKTCELWKQGLSFQVERMSNNKEQALTDEEIVTIYLNGVMTGRTHLKSIYNFTVQHLSGWFPFLGCYEAFIRRLNRISDVFSAFVEMILASELPPTVVNKIKIIDSFPIVMASAKRSNQAKVAPELANKGYCGSKDTFYYGVKLHVITVKRVGTIPMPEFVGLTQASCHDIVAFRQVVQELHDCDLFADKAYANTEDNAKYAKEQNLHVVTGETGERAS